MPDNARVDTDSCRRQFLQAVLSSAVVGVALQAGIELATPEKLSAQTNLDPDAALQELLAGNQRFAANQLTSIEHDLTILKEHTVGKQAPFAAVLACADSRVPVELVFDQTIGHIFVTRVAFTAPQLLWPSTRRVLTPRTATLPAPAAGGGNVWWQFRQSNRRQYEDSGRIAAHFLNSHSRCC
jgi:hypothetical protein